MTWDRRAINARRMKRIVMIAEFRSALKKKYKVNFSIFCMGTPQAVMNPVGEDQALLRLSMRTVLFQEKLQLISRRRKGV